MTVYLIIAILLIVTAILLFAPAALDFSFVWNEEVRRTSISFRYLFIKKNLDKQKSEKPKTKSKHKYTLDDAKNGVKRAYDLFNVIKSDLAKLLKYSKSKLIIIKTLDVNADFDTQDPMKTGILTGGINGGAYTLMSFIDHHMNLKKWSIKITPLFENRDFFDIRVEGIIEIKIAHIIVILLKSVPMLLNIRKFLKNNKKDERK